MDSLDVDDTGFALDECGGHDRLLRLVAGLTGNGKLLLLLPFDGVLLLFAVKLTLLLCAL